MDGQQQQQQGQQFGQPQQRQALQYQQQQQQQQQQRPHLAGGHIQQQQHQPQLERATAPSIAPPPAYASHPSGVDRQTSSLSVAGGAGGTSPGDGLQPPSQVGHLDSSAGQPMQHLALQQQQQQPVYQQYHPQQQQQQSQQRHALHLDPALQNAPLATLLASHPAGGSSDHHGANSSDAQASSTNGAGAGGAPGPITANGSNGAGKKKRAAPTRWFAADDAAMVRVLLAEKRAGHETEHGFLASSWERVVEAVQETTLQGQKKETQPCKDRLKLEQMIRTLYQPFKELMMHSDFHWSEAEQRFHASAEAWAKQIEVNPFAARYKSHSFPLFVEFEELVGYRRQHQLGQQLLHVHDPAFSQPQSQTHTHTHEGSPSTCVGSGAQHGAAGVGAFGDHLAGLGMGGMEESFMRVDDVASHEDGAAGLLGSVLNESFQHSMSSAGPSTSISHLPPPPPANNKRAYAAVSTTSLANAAALGVSGIGPPIKRSYFGPSSSSSSVPASHSAPSFAAGSGPSGSASTHHIVASLQQQLGNLDPALSALDNAQTLADIQGQLRELLTLVRRGVEIGEQVLAALPPAPQAASSSSSPDGSGSALASTTDAAPRPDGGEADPGQRRDSNTSGISGSSGSASQQRGPSAPPPTASSPPIHEFELKEESEDSTALGNFAPADDNDDEGPLTNQALLLITTMSYLEPSQKAALVERAGWDHDFVGELLHSAAGHGESSSSDEDELRRQLLDNALQTSGRL